jgi:hypothetical protein
MAGTELKFPIVSKSIKSIMMVFKTAGLEGNSTTDLFEIAANNSKYKVRISRNTMLANTKNVITITEFDGLGPTDGRVANLYINGKLAPINNAQITINQWTNLIIDFIYPASSNSSNYVTVYGNTSTSVSMLSSYSLPLEAKKESISYNFWDDTNNVNWYNYSSQNTWENVFASISSLDTVNTVNTNWKTFLNADIIRQSSELTLEDDLPLQLGGYEYKTFASTTKKSIYRSPA